MGKKGKISLEGYRKNSPDKNNDFNIIPSQYIDMHNVDHDVLMIPMGGRGTGNPVLAKPGEQYFFPNHDFVFEQAMPENAMMRYQRIMRNGGPLPKAQMYNSQVNVPLNTSDFIYSPEELEKYKNIYDQRIATCQKGDAACLEQANNYYNLYVAPKLNAPNTWQIAEKMGITTGPNNPRIREYGTAADSWDLPGLYKKAGAKVNLAAPIKNPDEIQKKLAGMSEEELKNYWTSMNLPLGALVNFGQAGLSEHYGKNQAYNVREGLVPSNHSARVVGYSPEGVPYIYDYGKVTPITDPTFKSMPLTIITSPQEIQGYTFENLKKQGKLEGSKMTPLNIKTKGADYDPDEYEPFIASLQKNKDMYANALGMSDEEYNNYAKHAAALALTETGGGDDTAIRWKGIIPVPSYVSDKLGFGDTKGITQINPDVLFGKKSLADKLETLGIRKYNYDPWNPDHAAIATMALLKDNKAVQDKYAKTAGNKADLSEAEKTYYQWSMPRTLRKGEAKGESEKIKRYLENYNKIQANFDSHNRYLAENRKHGGPLPMAQDGRIQEKPWGEMTPQERAAYLNAKEKKKPISKAQADAWAKQAEEQSRKKGKQEYYEDYVREGTKKALTHPLLNFPTTFMPEGMAIGMLQSAANYPMHLANDQYGMAALDLLGAIPFSGTLAQSVTKAGKKVIPVATKQVQKLFKTPKFIQSLDELNKIQSGNKFKSLDQGQAYFQRMGNSGLQSALAKRNLNVGTVNDYYNALNSDVEKTKFLNHLYDVLEGSKIDKAVSSIDQTLGNIAVSALGQKSKAPELKTIVDEANKKLTKGLGIKKGDMPISLEIAKHDPSQINVKIGDTNTGYLNLAPVGTKDIRLSQLLKGDKPSMAKNYFEYENFVNATQPGYAKAYDFPFTYTDVSNHPYYGKNLKGQGYSAELNEAINRSLKERGARLYSGSTGHTEEGAARYANLLQKGLVEDISPRIPGSHNLMYPQNPLYMYKRYGGDPSLPAITGHYKKGGRLPGKHETNKNIKSSINYLMRRNETLFGPAGKNFYNPNPMSKYYKGGIAFPQQPTAGDTKGQQESEFYSPNWIPPGPVGFYEHGGIAYPQLPTEDYFFSGSPWMPHYNMGGLPGGANNMPCYECGGYKEYGGLPMAQPGMNFTPMSTSDSLAVTKYMNSPGFQAQYGNYNLDLKRGKKYDTLTKTHKKSGTESEVTGWEKDPVKKAALNEYLIQQQMQSGQPVTGTPYFANTYNQVQGYKPLAKNMYGGYEQKGGFMNPDNMMNYPIFSQGGDPYEYEDGGNVLGLDQDQIVRTLGNNFLSGVEGNLQNNIAREAGEQFLQNPYGVPQAQDGYNMNFFNDYNKQNLANINAMQDQLENLQGAQNQAFINLGTFASNIPNWNKYTKYTAKKKGSGTLPGTADFTGNQNVESIMNQSAQSGMAKYGTAYIPAAQNGRTMKGFEIPAESNLLSKGTPINFPSTRTQQAAANPDEWMSADAQAKKKAFYDAAAAYDQKWAQQQSQGRFAPGYQTIYDMFDNDDYRVGRMSRGMRNMLPYLMFNPQNTYLQEYKAKKALFGPGARKVSMKFRTVFDPRTGQQVQVPVDNASNVSGKKVTSSSSDLEKATAAQQQQQKQNYPSPFGVLGYPLSPDAYNVPENPAYAYGTPPAGTTFANNMAYAPAQSGYPTMPGYNFNAQLGPAISQGSVFPQNPMVGPRATQGIDPQEGMFMGMPKGYIPKGLNLMGELQPKANGGMKYKEGGIHELTEDEIQQIMAAGGSITYLD